MKLRTRLFAVLMVFGVALFIVGTGAFSTVSAERTVSVNVAGDGDALLKLTPHDGPNGQTYADNSSEELGINLASGDASGVNQNAATTIKRVFNITNQGTQAVDVHINKSGNNSALVEFQDDTGNVINGSANAVNVDTGETVQVALKIDTKGESLGDGDEILDSITIHANA